MTRCGARLSRCSRRSESAQDFLKTPAADLAARLMTDVHHVFVDRATARRLSRAIAAGCGGMGEVYRARDTTLGRDVALKVLPAMFTTDRDRLARFEREARTLATLNHPHIGAIYGLEDADGIRALVLELVEGERWPIALRSGPVPLTRRTDIARADCRSPGSGARQRHRSSRPEAGQYQGHTRRHR